MAHFKCKMCGGTLTFEPGAAVGICDACGAEQALPLPDDEPQDRDDPAHDEIYQNGLQRMREAVSKTDYKEAARVFSQIKGYRDADERAKECREKAQAARKDAIYADAAAKVSPDSIASNEAAIRLFESIADWKDSRDRIDECKAIIDELRYAEEQAAEEKRAARKRLMSRLIKIAALVAVATAVVSLVLIKAVIPAGQYRKAAVLYSDGKYEEALAAFEALGNYRDCNSRVRDCQARLMDDALKAQNAGLKTAAVGAVVRFGLYEQDNNAANGPEEIEWQVLAVQDSYALLVSRYALDCRAYNSISADVTWATCSLRRWLNNDFLNAAFSSQQQRRIEAALITDTMAQIVTEDAPQVTETTTEELTGEEEPDEGPAPVSYTSDQVFLLSVAEVKTYLKTDEARRCAPTPYAIEQGAWTSDSSVIGGKPTGWWWLRSPGETAYTAVSVISDGTILARGLNVYHSSDCVRPAVWINMAGEQAETGQ